MKLHKTNLRTVDRGFRLPIFLTGKREVRSVLAEARDEAAGLSPTRRTLARVLSGTEFSPLPIPGFRTRFVRNRVSALAVSARQMTKIQSAKIERRIEALLRPLKHPTRIFSVKQLGLVVMVSISLYSIVALANHNSFSDNNRDVPDLDAESQATYLKRVEAQLDRLEKYIDQIKGNGAAYASVESYMTVDDIELLLKDVRGDLSKLQALQPANAGKVELGIDQKLTDIRGTLARVGKPIPLNDAPPEVIMVSRE